MFGEHDCFAVKFDFEKPKLGPDLAHDQYLHINVNI